MNRPLARSPRGLLGRAAVTLFVASGALALGALGGCSKPAEHEPPVATKDAASKPHAHAAHGAQPGAATPAGAATGRKAYGAAIDTKTPEVTLSEVLAAPSKYADKNVRMTGTITAVCQGMGCWLQLGDPKGNAHVKLRGHSFFVPKNSSGRSAVVEAKVLPALDEGHCEEEAKEQTGVVAKVELEASGVEIF